MKRKESGYAFFCCPLSCIAYLSKKLNNKAKQSKQEGCFMTGLIVFGIIIVVLAIIYFVIRKFFTNKWGPERGVKILHYIFSAIGGVPLSIFLIVTAIRHWGDGSWTSIICLILGILLIISLIKGLCICPKCKKFFAYIQEKDEFVEEVSHWLKRESVIPGKEDAPTRHKWVCMAKNKYLRRWHCACCDHTEEKYIIKKEKIDDVTGEY